MLSAGSKVGPYEVLSLLGEGGMGQVYRGRDPRLGRDIAIKVLSSETSHDTDATARLEREARAIAALSHPNILAVHDVGRENATFYLVTELLEGKTLRDQIRDTPLTWRRAVEIGAEVAEGLAAAHAKSIVHRDLKPENIFVTEDGRVKILDFGLAQTDPSLLQRDEANIPTTKWFQTRPGTVIGTLGYMSPEQLRGEAVDPSADIFSLGCILYEMVTAKKPFHRESGAATIAAILKDALPREELSAAVPIEFQRIIEGCVEKSPMARFQSARDLALTLRAIGSSTSHGDLLKTVVPRRSTKSIDSIAILPLVNATNDPGAEYLSDGITEGIINKLSQLPKLKVMARSTVFRFKGRNIDAQNVGRELRVRAVLSGFVKQIGDRLQISVELVDSLDGAQLWGESYSRGVADLVKLQEELAGEIAEKLRPKLTGAEKKKLRRKSTDSSEAYQLYLKGRYHWNKRTEESLRKGIQFFREAIESDPSFASAYAGLADSFITLATNIPLPPHDAMPKAKAAAMRAIEIDDGLAEAWASLGAVRWWFEWDWEGAEEAYRRAIDLNPNYATAHDGYAMLLSARGRVAEAVEQFTKAADLDPLSLIIAVHAGWPFYFARDFESAIRKFRKALELDERFIPAHGWLGMALGQQRRYGEAVDAFRRALEVDRVPILLSMLAHTYAIAGQDEDALELVGALNEEAERRYISPYDIAVIHAGLGDAASAVAQLRKALEDRSAWMVFLNVDPRLDAVRDEPAFAEIAAILH
ncbi:MAG TPA: protein kinase [Thermoanaerobaculia bacterium]|jgi:serine/threonine protein kinase/tetratricopeptide (TPR) repeat protein